MLVQARYDEMKEKLLVIKNLYQSRHYTQCAVSGERLLVEIHDEIHPIHLAYLNFYIALSHDTLAREAARKNRYQELCLAEEYYTIAISALSPLESKKSEEEQLPSPTSITSNENRVWKRRSSNAGSFDSTTSAASSATSYGLEDHTSDSDLPPKCLPPQNCGDNLTTKPKCHNAIVTPLSTRPQTPQECQFRTDTSAFIRMIEGHLASARELKYKTEMPPMRFTLLSPRPSPTTSKSRTSHLFDEKEAEVVRQNRKKVTFRPRFDPADVQRLCSEALDELS